MNFLTLTFLGAMVAGLGACPLRADTASPVTATAAAVDRKALKAQIQDSEAQIKALHVELQQLNSQKAALWDQVGTLRNKKHLVDLQHRLDDLGTKLSDALAKSNTAKAGDLSGRQAVLQKELALQQDIAGLLTKLEAAHAGADTPTAKSLSDELKADRDNVKALYPAKPGAASATAVSTTARPAAAPKPEDPEIQTLLDKIHTLEDQIKQDQAKLVGLKTQVTGLRDQLKAAGK